MSSRALTLILASLLVGGIGKGVAQAQNANPTTPTQSELVNQANAPISSLFQIRLQDSYAPAFQGQLRGQGNFFSIQVGMPLPQISAAAISAAITVDDSRCGHAPTPAAVWFIDGIRRYPLRRYRSARRGP